MATEAHGAGLVYFASVVERGHEDDGDLLPAGIAADAPQDVYTADARHDEIQNDAIGQQPALQGCQRRLAVAGLCDAVPVAFDHFTDHLAGYFVVIHK